MNDFLCLWAEGFSEGLDVLDNEGRSRLLACCARKCADTGVAERHRRLYAEAGSRDEYYRRLHELGGVRGKILSPGAEYLVVFPDCACDLHTCLDVNTPRLCECSRQSLLYVTQQAAGTSAFTVDCLGTVLTGEKDCRFRIAYQNPPDRPDE